MMIDSNIIIYSLRPEFTELRDFITEHDPFVSAVSYVEVLGFHRLTPADRVALEEFFTAAEMLPITQPILDKAVRLRQLHKMSLGDALLAATALVNGLRLATRNVPDFAWVPGLIVVNPLAT